MKRIALLAVIILLTLTLLMVAWQLRNVVFVFLAALAISATFNEPVEALVRRGWAKSLAILTIYLGVLGTLLGVAALLFFPMANEIDPLITDLLATYGRWQTTLVNPSDANPRAFATRLPNTDQLMLWLADGQRDVLMSGLFGVMQSVGNVLGQLALALVIAIYWSADSLRFERLWLSLLPPEQRTSARRVWQKVQTDVGAYLRSELAQTLLAGALLTLGFWLIGVRYPFVLALVSALAWLVPIIGVALAVIFAAIIGGLSGVWVAAGAVLLVVAVLALMEYMVEPRFYKHERYWGVLVVLVMLAMGDVLGLFGLLVAPPLAVAIQIALNELLERPATPLVSATSTARTTETRDLTPLNSRLVELQGRIVAIQGEAAPRLAQLTSRLEELLRQVETEKRPKQQTIRPRSR